MIWRSLLKASGVLIIGFICAAIILQLTKIFDPADITYQLNVDTNLVYDATGLYEGGGLHPYRLDSFGLSLPRLEEESDRYELLFLGDSIVEASQVAPETRAAYVVGTSDTLRVYNGARAGANIYDMLYNYRHFQRTGVVYDAVVVATQMRDYAVTIEYDNDGDSFNHATYRARATSSEGGGLIDTVRDLEIVNFLRSFYRTQIAANLSDARVTNPSLAGTLESRANFLEGKTLVESLDDCPSFPRLLETYEAAVRDGFQRLLAVAGESQTQVIALSLVDGYTADEADYLVDLRTNVPCGDDLVLSFEASHQVYDITNAAYLRIAEELGIATVDLRGALSDRFNDEGGQLTYDGIHFTEVGNRLVGETLRPVLEELIARD